MTVAAARDIVSAEAPATVAEGYTTAVWKAGTLAPITTDADTVTIAAALEAPPETAAATAVAQVETALKPAAVASSCLFEVDVSLTARVVGMNVHA